MRSPHLVLLALLVPASPAVADDLLVTSWNSGSVLRYDDQSGAFLGPLIAPGSGLALPHSAVFGPDGAVYVTSFGTQEVLRVDPQTGAISVFVTSGAGGLAGPTDALFGPDGNLYVASRGAAPGIKRYDGSTGAFLDQYVGPGNGMVGTETGDFGPDGHFYLASGTNSQINRYDGLTGAFLDVFLPSGVGGLDDPHDFAFGANGHLFATSFGGGNVKEYDRAGNFVGNLVTGIPSPHGIDFRPDGLLYVTSFGTSSVRRYDAATGAFVDTFIPTGSGGLAGAISLTFADADTLSLRANANTFSAWRAEPGETMFFLIGVGEGARRYGNCPGFLVGMDRPFLIGQTTTDASGTATFPYAAPATLSGRSVLMQVLAPQSCRRSSILPYRFP